MSQHAGAEGAAGTGGVASVEAQPASATQQDSSNRAAELARLLETRRGERHIVALQDFPDPDAISCGMAYREIAKRFEIDADLVYDGQISHPENRALVNLLDVEVRQYARDLQLDAYNAAVFVDNQGATTHLTERLKAAGVPTLAVVDHHDADDVLDPIFSDVRPLGAAATIFAEYLSSGALLKLDAENEGHMRLATALMHGLHSETDGFVRARPAEYRAAAFLSRYMDPDLLERVLCVQKSSGTLRVIERALHDRVVASGYSVAGVGFVRWGDRDAIPVAADFLLTEENVHTSIVYGLLGEEDGREVVSGSLRTTHATMQVDRFLKAALGEDLRGRPYGGGRSRAGGFEIDVGFLRGDEDDPDQQAMKWALFDRRIRRKLFREAGVEDLDEVCGREGDRTEEEED
ncbi:MAG TPA: bifunctional oligoribonuclease/PAP phosphatase NrnA [Longimicrobium sp.]|nr:bifunctional oligoribonuclease/PAP phosphatase NrnA [Longimicrobium sp.]